MKWWLYGLLGILAYLFFLLATLPVQHALDLLAANEKPVMVEQARGSVWNGEAARIQYANQTLGPVQWRFKPFGLLQGEIQYRLELQHQEQFLAGLVGRRLFSDRFHLADIKGFVATDTLFNLTGETSFNAGGQVDLELQELVISNRHISAASGRIQWIDASIQSPLEIELGNLQFILFNDGEVVKSEVEDLDGRLQVDGEIALFPDGSYQFQGKVKPSTASDRRLISLLETLGRRAADGSTEIDYRGQF